MKSKINSKIGLLEIVKKDFERKNLDKKKSKLNKKIDSILETSKHLDEFYNKAKLTINQLHKLEPGRDKRFIDIPLRNKVERHFQYKLLTDEERVKLMLENLRDPFVQYSLGLLNKKEGEEVEEIDHYYVSWIMKMGEGFSDERKIEIVNEFQKYLNQSPDISKLLNDTVKKFVRIHEDRMNEYYEDVRKLRDDRIYLYELSLKVSTEQKYKVIIEGIKKGKFELSKLREVKKYLFEKIPVKENKKSKVTQITEHLYVELNKKYVRNTIQSFIQKLN